MEEERLKLAKLLFDGDESKAIALLQLIDSKITTPSSFPNLTMNIPDTGEPIIDCVFCGSDGTCLFDFPDSALVCKGRCEHLEYLD